MILENKGGLTFFRFSNLSEFPELRHGVFSRHGGVSAGVLGGLNVGMGVMDDPVNVKKNREMIREVLGAECSLYLSQVHGTGIYCPGSVEDIDRDSPVTSDAVVTGVTGVAAAICTADCQPVLLYDPVKKVIGNVHSGWRGSISNIVGKTVRSMVEEFGCDSSRIRAGIGPSLGPCCSEFINYRDEIPREFWDFRIGKHHFDFWAVTRKQLTAEGVDESHIETAGVCTRCASDLFFSYRKEKLSGRFASVISLVKP